MSAPMPEGWTRVEADEAQAELLEVLHPELAFVAEEPLFVGATVDTTGARLADAGDELAVRSIGNNVARVYNVATGLDALLQLSQLAGQVRRLEVLE